MANTKKAPIATKREAAEFLSVSTRTIDRMIADGQLKPLPFRGFVRIRWSDLNRIASRGVGRKRHKKVSTN